jgi:hypothetical protein
VTDEARRVLLDLTESELVMDAVKELIDAEFEERVSELRAAVRADQHSRAREIEGELELLCQLPGLLKKHAAKAVYHRA